MKKILSIAAFLLIAASSEAQTVNVHKTDGTTVKYDASQVEYIDFSEASGSTAPEAAKAIDLGLPSGTKWANMNVGATKPEDYGLYFAWGETVGYTGDTSDGRLFDWANYKWCDGSHTTLTKYCNKSDYGKDGFTDDKTVLDAEDDAATANWGEGWRMPTKAEIKELLDNTTNEWTELNGVKGRKFTSNTNGNSIFLPASGYRNGGSLDGVGSVGIYWSSSLLEGGPAYACSLDFYSGNADWSGGYRRYGQSVRPVRSE
ncbi:MAG: hypothetical protein IKT22_01410 [Prevotella sp.]|nr:hypothetical protein [Prevotella sp.]MBR6446508.1 hypothetical protein [Prevotella sp.]MBR6493916.1 hypothetical protein [Prevotella sp.]